MGGSDNPELQRLLASLSRYSGSNVNPPNIQNTQTPPNSDFHSSPIPGLGFLAPEPLSNSPHPQSRSTTPSQSTLPKPRASKPCSSPHASPLPPSKTPIPDASTITTWPAAVKHVTKHLAPQKSFESLIRNLIHTQHAHEQTWHSLRQAVVSMQASRATTSAQASAIIRSLNPAFNPSTTTTNTTKHQDPTTNVNDELAEQDRKIYANLLKMVSDFDRQLREAGVPFYAIRHDLVILEEGRERSGAVAGRIDRGELRELQRRMLVYLEDLCGE